MVVSLDVLKHLVRGLRSQPVIDLQTFLINKGRGFTVSDRVTDVGIDESIYLFVNNPEGSGYDYDAIVQPRAGGEADINISFGADGGDAGEAVTAHNLKAGSPRTFGGTVEESQTGDTGTLPSHGTTVIEDFAPGGTQGVKVGPAGIGAISLTIDEGSNKLFELVNRSGGGTKLALNIQLFEVDGTYKEI